MLLLLSLLWSQGGTPHFPPPLDCRVAVTRAYHDLAVATAPQQRQVLHLRFATETTSRVPNQQQERRAASTGDLFVRGRRLSYQTPEVQVWQDGQIVCSVLRRQRLVLLTRVPASGEAGSLPPILMLRDSLIQQATVQLCRQEKVDGQIQQHVRLALPTRQAQRVGLQTLDFYLAPTAAQLRRAVAVYQPNHAARQVTLSFTQQEWLATSPELTDDARGRVLDAQGRLRPAYEGYRLLDQTKPTRKI